MNTMPAILRRSEMLTLILGVCAGGLLSFLALRHIFPGKKTQSPAIISHISPAPTGSSYVFPTAADYSPTVDLSDYSVLIQNGSPTEGEEGRVRDLLEGEGFGETKIETAPVSTYQQTVVNVKPGVPLSVLQAIQHVLEKKYPIVTGQALEQGSVYDIVVIVGAKKNGSTIDNE